MEPRAAYHRTPLYIYCPGRRSLHTQSSVSKITYGVQSYLRLSVHIVPKRFILTPVSPHEQSLGRTTTPITRAQGHSGFKSPLVITKALEYIDSIDSNLICPICCCPFVSPQRLPCDHYFCKA